MAGGYNDPENIARRIQSDGMGLMLIYSIVKAAYEIFEEAGCPSDFCLQLATDEVLVFGGTNRLKWDAANSFYPDRSYCTEKFLTAFDWLDGEDAQ